jgi:hypothetical protein
MEGKEEIVEMEEGEDIPSEKQHEGSEEEEQQSEEELPEDEPPGLQEIRAYHREHELMANTLKPKTRLSAVRHPHIFSKGYFNHLGALVRNILEGNIQLDSGEHKQLQRRVSLLRDIGHLSPTRRRDVCKTGDGAALCQILSSIALKCLAFQ